MVLQQKIIQISGQLFDFLLEYRERHPDFRFWLRSREHNQAEDQARLKHGQWFQGSDYIFLSFHSASGHVNMTRSIGWVVNFDKQLNPSTAISIVWPKEKDQRKIDAYLDIIETLGGFEMVHEVKYRKQLPIEDIFLSLTHFLEEILPQINTIIDKHGLTKEFTIPEEKFIKRLDKVLMYRDALSAGAPAAINGISNNRISSANGQQILLNTILYGPPGTGKTYHTIDKALQIVAPDVYEKSKTNRSELTKTFRNLLIDNWENAKGQIAFITFHQSMGYEDFVEGIKPQKPKPGEPLNYDIESGIFKLLSKLARSNFESAQRKTQLLPFEEAFERFKQSWEDNPSQTFPLKTVGYDFTVIGFTNTSIQFRKASGGTSHTLSINTLKEQYYGKEYNFKQGVGIYYPPILAKVLSYSSESQKKIEPLNYVLIIDEINRGNVSQVFGELITLIENGKRIGSPEQLEVILPYSKETFGVPSNLYIIGTMNTADRSVEALDTALRRRFVFEEMNPQPQLLNSYQRLKDLWFKYKHTFEGDKEWIEAEDRFKALHGMTVLSEERYTALKPSSENIDEELAQRKWEDFIPVVTFNGVDLEKLLRVINKRLQTLLTADHQIGHAWLMNVFSLADLKAVFQNSIVPLLREYFYGDYGKIGLVLGSGFVEQITVAHEDDFAKFEYDTSLLTDRPVYQIKNVLQMNDDEFKTALQLLLPEPKPSNAA